MRGDFTRRTFRARNHYRGVLHQQGRVQLDADANEQVEIQAHLDEAATRDTVGRHGGPLAGAGFAIDGALTISAGTYYVDGILCENEEPVPLAGQPDLPGVPLPTGDGRYAGYLDVWREHLTAAERPELREVALGGPDTTTRSRTVWQVRLAPVQPGTSCVDLAPPWQPDGLASTGRLRARAQPPAGGGAEPCVIPETAGYRRLENQLYRVEILDGSAAPGGPTFIWSRDNGTVVGQLTGIVPVAAGTELTLAAPGRDERLGFAPDDWVEVTDLGRARRGEPGFVGRLVAAEGPVLTAAGDSWAGGTAPTPADLGQAPVVRRWDGPDGPEPVDSGQWLDLEDGVQVQFEPGGVFHTGDYWLIPARTAQPRTDGAHLAGDVEWPASGGEPAFQSRHGVEHRIAAIALLERAGGDWSVAADCRRLFPPVTELTSLAYAGGDGQEAMPGQPLPQPLQVSVSNGTAPVAGAAVRFTAAAAELATTPAGLAQPQDSVELTTGPDGLARCFWLPAPAGPSRSVRAVLLRSDGTPTGTPVDFTANQSVASQVGYDPAGCAALAGADTVQQALAVLAGRTTLVAVGGDGQAGAPGTALPFPMAVQVRSDCGPVAGAQVRCRVDSGGVAATAAGLAQPAAEVVLTTGADGLARCFWRLGPDDPVQLLQAELAAGAGVAEPARHAFTANLRTAAGTVPGLRVQEVVLAGDGSAVARGTFITPDQLGEGVTVTLDGEPDPATVDGQPVLALSADLPFPLTPAEQDEWQTGPIGTRAVTLAGEVTAAGEGIDWRPAAGVVEFLDRLLAGLAELERPINRVLCQLWLSGRDIADPAGERFLNGLSVGGRLPTVDDVRAADYRVWFWLARTIERLIVVPARDGLFRMLSMRNAVTLSLPPEALRAAAPGEVRLLAAREPDLAGAERAVARAFRDRDEPRRVVLVAAERHAAAGAVLAGALAPLGVELELLVVDDPTAVATARLEAGQQLDGVLTATSAAAAVTDRTGFSEPFAL